MTTIDTSRFIDPEARDHLMVSGADAHSYLQSQLSQDIANLDVGASQWTFVLEPTGKVESLARVTRTAEDRFDLDTDVGFGEPLRARLDRFKIRVDVELELSTGPGTDPSPDVEADRISAGWPRMGAEIVPGETIPATTGLAGLAVSFTKGCYPGQELVERMDSRGADAPRTLRIVDVGTDASVGDPIVDESGDEVGTLTSVSPHGGVALGYVRRGSDVGRPPDHVR